MPELSTRYGLLEAFNADDDLISRFLAKYGEWAQYELAFIADCLPRDGAIADIGAFLGTFGLGVAQLKPISKLCFVDANPVTIPLLCRNVARNLKVPSVVLEAVVGGDGNQHQGARVHGNMGSFSVAQGGLSEGETSACAVESVSLRELTERHGPFDLYKIDAEGMEGKILREDIAFLRDTQSAFWLECNSTSASLDLGKLLLDHGFKVFYFAYPAISRENFNGERDREFPFAYEAGLFASKTFTPTMSKELIEAGCVLKEFADVETLREALWLTPRWSPKEWDGRGLHEVVALASHALLGEEYVGFLCSNEAEGTAPKWADPLPLRLQKRLDSVAQCLAQSSEALAEAIETQAQLRSAFQTTSEALKAREMDLRDSKSLVRAHEIMLFKERERSGDAIKLLQAELTRALIERDELAAAADATHMHINALADRLNAVHQSKSWRISMPLRMVGRMVRGEWREMYRLICARRSSS